MKYCKPLTIYSRLMKLFLNVKHPFINVRTNKENSLIKQKKTKNQTLTN